MKIISAISWFLFFSFKGFSQEAKEVFRLYEKTSYNHDTTLFCTVLKDSNGYLFSFTWMDQDFDIKKDSSIMSYSEKTISYGPYSFVKKRGKIIFKDFSRNSRFADLYTLDYNENLAPDLFSSATDTYAIPTTLIDENAEILSRGIIVVCYNFLQVIRRPFDKIYLVVYLEKKTLLPFRIEEYSEKDLKNLLSTIFIPD